MQSILIISQNPEKRMLKAHELLEAEKVDMFDRVLVEREEVTAKTGVTKQKQSLGIEDVKLMQKNLSLKPFKSDTKAVVITDAHLLTIEAQNALLKVLEEPPPNTILILLSATEEALLPTVLSRCYIVTLEGGMPMQTDVEQKQFLELADSLSEWGIGRSLREAEQLSKNKEAALSWMNGVIIASRQKLLEVIQDDQAHPQKRRDYLTIITSFEKAHRDIKNTNINLRLALEALFLRV